MLEAVLASAETLELKAFFAEVVSHELDDVRLVLDHYNALHHAEIISSAYKTDVKLKLQSRGAGFR
jgi:hypothetical protein